eukprot:3017354-Rhodomonas_salina.1
MSQTSVMYHKAQHIDTRVYHLRELCKEGVLVLKKVASADQVPDSLTKSKPKPAFEKHWDAMLGVQSTLTSETMLRPDIADQVDEMEGIELEA